MPSAGWDPGSAWFRLKTDVLELLQWSPISSVVRSILSEHCVYRSCNTYSSDEDLFLRKRWIDHRNLCCFHPVSPCSSTVEQRCPYRSRLLQDFCQGILSILITLSWWTFLTPVIEGWDRDLETSYFSVSRVLAVCLFLGMNTIEAREIYENAGRNIQETDGSWKFKAKCGPVERRAREGDTAVLRCQNCVTATVALIQRSSLVDAGQRSVKMIDDLMNATFRNCFLLPPRCRLKSLHSPQTSKMHLAISSKVTALEEVYRMWSLLHAGWSRRKDMRSGCSDTTTVMNLLAAPVKSQCRYEVLLTNSVAVIPLVTTLENKWWFSCRVVWRSDAICCVALHITHSILR